MAEEKFEFGGQSFVYEKNETNWELKLKRSDVASQDLRELTIGFASSILFGAIDGV